VREEALLERIGDRLHPMAEDRGGAGSKPVPSNGWSNAGWSQLGRRHPFGMRAMRWAAWMRWGLQRPRRRRLRADFGAAASRGGGHVGPAPPDSCRSWAQMIRGIIDEQTQSGVARGVRWAEEDNCV